MFPLKDDIIIKLIWGALIFSAIGILITLVIYLAYGHIAFFNAFDDGKIEALGTFVGGFFGTILTIAATFLIWLTYNSQKRELEKTIQIAKIQSETLIVQQFESTFFNMAKILSEIPTNVNGKLLDKSFKVEYAGYNFFEKALFNIMQKFDPDWNWDTISSNELMETTAKIYNEYAEEYLSPLDHYFRYFYNILKFIDNSKVENKKMYADLLQAQMAKTQLGLIFYNGIGKIGKAKLYGLLEKYNFLENLNHDSIYIKNNSHTKLYPFTTFKFLSSVKKGEIVLNAVIMNPDKVEANILKKYYIDKYNVSNDVVRAIYKSFEIGEITLYQKNIDRRIIINILDEMLKNT